MSTTKTLGCHLLFLSILSTAPLAKADTPECETLEIDQPSPMLTDLNIVYTWESSCANSPKTVVALRDDAEVKVSFDKSKDGELIRYEGTLRGTTAGMHHIGVAVTLDDGSSYDLIESVLVSGTTAKGAESTEVEDDGSGGCFVAKLGRPKGATLFGLLTALWSSLSG